MAESMSNVRSHRMRLALWIVALFACGTAPSAFACAGAVPVDVAFDQGSSLLSTSERSKLESGVRQARTSTGNGELKVALAIYSQNREAGSTAELNRLTEARVSTLRETLVRFGVEAAAVIAVRGDPATLQAPAGTGGVAEVQIAFGCQVS